MKITNKNIRAAKRFNNGLNGMKRSDYYSSHNRTHKKSENAANERRSDSPAPKP